MDGGDVSGLGFGPPPLPEAGREKVPGRPPAVALDARAGQAVGARKPAGGPGAARGKPARTSRPGQMIVAGLAGFVAGAVCWHFVGFWGFMTEAVFYARPEGTVKNPVRPSAVAMAKIQNRQPGAAGSAQVSCSLAVKDAAGDVQPRGCEGHTYKFHPSRSIVRADRGDFGPAPVPTLISGEAVGVVAVGGWSARIEGPDASKPPVVTAPGNQ